MKIILTVLLLGLTLTGCSDSSTYYREGVGGNTSTFIYKVNDKPLECIHKLQGMSCNWEKYNANQ